MRRRVLLVLALLVLGALGWMSRVPAPLPAQWAQHPPPVSKGSDAFTLRVLELDPEGRPKDPGQLEAIRAAARQASDAFLFIHGWRRDARSLETMEAFLDIYRDSIACLTQRDEEGTTSCAAVHGFCHLARVRRLVVLVLWDADTGLLTFRKAQTRALTLGRQGLAPLLGQIHQDLGGRGTFLAMGHSLGAAALASALHEYAMKGPLPVDGAVLLMGAFEPGLLLDHAAAAQGLEGPLLLNGYNRADGYLRLYRWVYGGSTAGEAGLPRVPSSEGSRWVAEGATCNGMEATRYGASLVDGAQARRLDEAPVALLNLDVTPLVSGHVDISNPKTLRLYNRVATELLFRALWRKAFPEG